MRALISPDGALATTVTFAWARSTWSCTRSELGMVSIVRQFCSGSREGRSAGSHSMTSEELTEHMVD